VNGGVGYRGAATLTPAIFPLMYLKRDTGKTAMAAATSMLHVRIDEDLKEQATQALAAMGLTASDAVRLLFHRVVAEQAFPFELKVPNAETRAAMEESRQIMAERRARFAGAEDMIAELDRQAG